MEDGPASKREVKEKLDELDLGERMRTVESTLPKKGIALETHSQALDEQIRKTGELDTEITELKEEAVKHKCEANKMLERNMTRIQAVLNLGRKEEGKTAKILSDEMRNNQTQMLQKIMNALGNN